MHGCHYPVLDGLDQPFQATVYFPLSSAIDKSQQNQQFFPLKKFRNAGSHTGAAGYGSKYANHCTMLPLGPLLFAGQAGEPKLQLSDRTMSFFH